MSDSGIAKVGEVAAKLMDALDNSTVEIGEVMLLVERRWKDDDGECTDIYFRCTDERNWVQRGMLSFCLDGMREPYEEADDE